MAKIAKIRFVNFVYNDNRHIYDQTFDFYNGENSLLNLQNGGGKTVLVQMMMQPIVPKQKLKDRLFKNYFTNAKAPCYIMIEWILDDRPERVLTGIGIKRVVSKNIEDESDSLKIITFLSEYEDESSYDIRNLELLEEEKGIVRLLEFDKVVRNLSSGEKDGSKVWLFRWDLTDDKKEYTRRLLEYKINPMEWKNLMVKINESEAGLNSFFSDCKTTNALIKKWFLPTIEEQLNKNGDFIENIKELIKNHAAQLVKNENMIKEREIFDEFKTKSAELVKSLDSYGKFQLKSEKNKSDLGNAYLYVHKELNGLILKKEELIVKVKQTEEEKKEQEYEKMSGEYHDIASALQSLKENVSQVDEKIKSLKVDIDDLEYKKKLLLGIQLMEKLKELGFKITKFEMEMEKENLQQEDIRAIILNLEYSLKEKYQDKILLLEDKLGDEKKQLEDEKTGISDNLASYEKLKKKMASLQDGLIAIRSGIALFDEREKGLRLAYPNLIPIKNDHTSQYDSDSLTDLKCKLDKEEEEIQKGILDNDIWQEDNRKASIQLEKESRELKEKSQALAIEKNKTESTYHIFENEKKAMDKILKAYQLTEDNLFDKAKILSLLHSDAEKYSKLIHDRDLENSVLNQQRKLYESGKVFELPEELKRALEENNIFIEYGYEWLRSFSDNKKEKQKLVKSNPFLPYSLIVSSEDLARIQNIAFEETLPNVIPIIEKEKLEDTLTVKQGKNIHSAGSMDFIINFDDRILNKNYLKDITDVLAIKIDKNNETIDKAQEALKNTELGILKAEGFPYTREYVEKLKKDITTYEGDIQVDTEHIGTIQKRIVSLSESIVDGYKLIGSLQDRKHHFERKKEDILGILDRYESYCRDLKEKKLKEEEGNDIDTAIKGVERDINKTRENLQEKGQLITNITAILNRDKINYQNYRDAKPGKRMEEDIEKLESKLNVLKLNTSGKIQNLQDILEDYRQRRNDKEKEINNLQLEENFYIGKEYNEFALETLGKDLVESNQNLNLLNEEKNRMQLTIAEKNSDIRYVGKNIRERCGYEEPKPEKSIRNIDFDSEKEMLQTRLKNLEKQLSQLKTQDVSLQKIMFGLEEYAAFASLAIQPYVIEGNLNEYVFTLVKEYKEFEVLVNETRNTLTAYYQNLETEFTGKTEMFKSLFQSILEGDKRYQPVHALNAINRVYLQIDRKLEQHSIDLKKIDDMERCIIDNTLSYLKNVYDEMNGIDRNSVIDVNGKRCKMLLIELPEKAELGTISLREYIRNTILKCENLCKQGKSVDGLLLNEISTYDLFDRLVGINKIQIHLMKIEPNRLKKKSWKQVIEENSGGERFVSAFVVFISLLTYMRGENLLGDNMDSKVLIMDNPFGPITSEHLLKPLFEIAKKYNTQMICLSDLKEHTIFDRFNLIYSLNIEREVGREDEYIELKTIKKDVLENKDEILSASMFKIEDRSRFERMN